MIDIEMIRSIEKTANRVVEDNGKQIFFGPNADEEAEAFRDGLKHMLGTFVSLLESEMEIQKIAEVRRTLRAGTTST